MALNPMTRWLLGEIKRRYDEDNDRVRNVITKVLGRDGMERTDEERQDLLEVFGLAVCRRVYGTDIALKDAIQATVEWDMLMECLSDRRHSFGIEH